jgi:VanZ family protein
MKKWLFRKDLSFFLTISWMFVIFYLSHQPAERSSELSGTFLKFMLTIIAVVPFSLELDIIHFLIRKSAHFIAYFMLGILLFHTVRLFYETNFIPMNVAFVLSILYAISDEYHQTFIPGRSGEVRDVILDASGSLTGIVLYALIIYLIIKRRQIN